MRAPLLEGAQVYTYTHIPTFMHTHIHVYTLTHLHTWQMLGIGWRRCIGCLIFVGHCPQKRPVISGLFAEETSNLRHSLNLRHPVEHPCSRGLIEVHIYIHTYIKVYIHTYIHTRVTSSRQKRDLEKRENRRDLSARNTRFNELQQAATYCRPLQHTATYWHTLDVPQPPLETATHTATRCNALRHTATHCTILQHTAPYRERHIVNVK